MDWDIVKTIVACTFLCILGLVGLALLMAVLAIPFWGAIWLIGEIVKAVV